MSSSNGNEATPLLYEQNHGTGDDEGAVWTIDDLANIVSQQHQSILKDTSMNVLARQIGCDDLKRGLSNNAVIQKQREQYGSNLVPLPPRPSLWNLCREELKDPTIVMLLCSALVSLFLGLGIEHDYQNGWIEGTSILVTVSLVVSVSSMTDFLKAKEFRDQQIELENAEHVFVVRFGEIEVIHPRDLVVGDVVRLAVGDIAPVDGVLVDASSELRMDESALTGEAELIPKSMEKDPFIISGTNVMQGAGKFLVLAVGANSMQGKIIARIRQEETKEGEKHEEVMDKTYWEAVKSFCSLGAGEDGANLMEKLDIMAVDIGKLGLMVALVVFVVLLVGWICNQFITNGACGERQTNEQDCIAIATCAWSDDGTCKRIWISQDLSTVLDFFITAVTILVVAVPEGLPLAVTLALAVSVRRMIQDNNQVKHVDSCETMGSATTICSDKTGTLTENKMTAMKAIVAGRSYEYTVGQSIHNNLGELLLKENDSKLLRLLAESILLNCNPTSKVIETETGIKYEGNATECALIKLTMQLGYDAYSVRRTYRKSDSMLEWGVYAIPFSSERKRMSWVVTGERHGQYRLFSKGAPNNLLESCDFNVSQRNVDDILPLKATDKIKLKNVVKDYQKAGLRTLAVAYRDYTKKPEGGWEADGLENGMTLLGIFGIEDPLRPSVPGAIADCRKAGIDVRMCTGDALITGVAIAKGCGILRSSDLDEDGNPKKNFAMTGAEFDNCVHFKDPDKPKVLRRVFDPEVQDAVIKLADPFKLDSRGNKMLDQAAFDQVWPTLRVLARCQPEDKLTLVRGMRQSKVFMDKERCADLEVAHGIRIFPDFQVVAVTGDGTNDAPALKKADIGFAMGIVGTETAKQACDIILLDDDFSSIVKAVMWGRNVFDSISKFIQFQLTVNIAAISLAVLGAFLYAASPLSPVQMLYVNMIMDSLGSLALATELPSKELLDRMPYGKHRPIISNIMASNIIGQACYQIAVLCWVLFAPQTLPIDPKVEFEPHQGSLHWSIFYNVFVLLQLFNEFNSRRLVTPEKLRSSFSEWNVFDGCLQNYIFILVIVGTFAVQIVIVQFGGVAVQVIPGGLNTSEWVFCVVAGAGGLVWQLVINSIIVIFASSCSYEIEVKRLESRIPSDVEIAEHETRADETRTAKNWSKLRLGVRQGFLYSRMFNLSVESGFKLGLLVNTKGSEAMRSELQQDLLRESMRVSTRETTR